MIFLGIGLTLCYEIVESFRVHCLLHEIENWRLLTILRITLNLQMLYRQLVNQQAAPPKILNYGAKSPLTKAFVQLAPLLDQTNTIIESNESLKFDLIQCGIFRPKWGIFRFKIADCITSPGFCCLCIFFWLNLNLGTA